MFRVTIENTENAAFCDHEGAIDHYAAGLEVARILRKVAETLENTAGPLDSLDGFTLLDYNGNRVGKVTTD